MKRIFGVILVCIVIAMCFSGQSVYAKSNKIYSFSGCKNTYTGYVSKGKLTRKRMTIYGSICRVKNRYKSNEKYKKLAKKKRVLKMSPTCNYYVAMAYGWEKISFRTAQTYFNRVVRNNVNDVTLHIKNARIIQIDFEA